MTRPSCSTCRPLGTGAHPAVRRLLDRLRPDAVRAKYRALGEVDLLATIAHAYGHKVRAIRFAAGPPVGRDVDVHLARPDGHQAGHVRLHVEPGASHWYVSIDVPDAVQEALRTLAPAWVALHAGEQAAVVREPLRVGASRRKAWTRVVDRVTEQRLRARAASRSSASTP
jgi:hypothetical protein